MKGFQEAHIVFRRYRDLDWLHKILQCKFPACIIPPIPPKSALGNWYGDESKHIQDRRTGIEKFLYKVTNHRRMCGSDDLASFLKDTDSVFEERKKNTESLVETGGSGSSYSAIAYNTISSYLSKASTTISSYVWSTTSKRKSSFGAMAPAAEEELSRFITQEAYLEMLGDSFG